MNVPLCVAMSTVLLMLLSCDKPAYVLNSGRATLCLAAHPHSTCGLILRSTSWLALTYVVIFAHNIMLSTSMCVFAYGVQLGCNSTRAVE